MQDRRKRKIVDAEVAVTTGIGDEKTLTGLNRQVKRRAETLTRLTTEVAENARALIQLSTGIADPNPKNTRALIANLDAAATKLYEAASLLKNGSKLSVVPTKTQANESQDNEPPKYARRQR